MSRGASGHPVDGWIGTDGLRKEEVELAQEDCGGAVLNEGGGIDKDPAHRLNLATRDLVYVWVRGMVMRR